MRLILALFLFGGLLEAYADVAYPPPEPTRTCHGNRCTYAAHEDDNLGHLVPGTKNVYIGSDHAARNEAWLRENNVKHIFSLGESVPFPHQKIGIIYKDLDVRAVSHKNIMHHVIDVHQYILNVPTKESVLLVDSGGVSDCSIFAVGHMLLSNWKLGVDEAVQALTASRNTVIPDSKFMVEIENLATTLYVYKLDEAHHKQHYLGTIKDDL